MTIHRPPYSLLPAGLAILAACLLASCASAPSRIPTSGRYGGTLELTAETDVKSLDPAIAYDLPAWSFIRLLYTGLLDYDDQAHLIPHGAASWSISPDGLTYTFHLRRDVCFYGPITHDRPVVASDYAYEIRRVMDPRTASPASDFYADIVGARAFRAGKARDIAGLQARGPWTLVIRLSRPRPEFAYIMAMPFAYAVPHEILDRYGAEGFQEHAEGSGPFHLAYWRRNLDIRLDRNPHYFEPGLPYLSHIHEIFGVEPINAIMMFETGEEDMTGIPSADFVRITSDPVYKPYIVKQVQMAIFYISLNCEMPPLNRLPVRQAINYAINRGHLIQLLNNRAVLAGGVLPPGMPGYDPDLKAYAYDPGRARRLLRQAGLPNGFSTTLWVRSSGGNGDEMRLGQSIQQDLKAVGIQTDIKAVAFPVWLSEIAREKHVPMSMNDWYQDFPDPSDFLDVLLNSKQAIPRDGNNSAFYKSKAMDALLNKASSDTNPQDRLALYRQANRLAVHDAPWVFLYYPVSYNLRRPWVHGYVPHPVWVTRYERIWLSRQGVAT